MTTWQKVILYGLLIVVGNTHSLRLIVYLGISDGFRSLE